MLKMFRKKFLGKNTTSWYTEEEQKMAAEYLYSKQIVHDNLDTIKAFKEWLESELATTTKLWINFNRAFSLNFQLFLEKVPHLQSTSYKMNKKLFHFTDELRLICPFDEDSNYRVKYVEDTPIDIEQLPQHWAPPYGMDFCKEPKPERELTFNEYCALIVYEKANRYLSKLKELILFAEDPSTFAYEQIEKCKEKNNDESLNLWTFAMLYEYKPFALENKYIFSSSPRCSRFINYFKFT